MIVPDKFTTLDESILGKTVHVLQILDEENDLIPIFNKTSKKIPSIEDLILVLDVLYILGKVNFDKESKKIITLC